MVAFIPETKVDLHRLYESRRLIACRWDLIVRRAGAEFNYRHLNRRPYFPNASWLGHLHALDALRA